MASVGCIAVTRQKRSRTSWGLSIGSKITRRYRAVVVDMIGADSPGGRAAHRSHRSFSPAPPIGLPRPGTAVLTPLGGPRPLRNLEDLGGLDGESGQDIAAVELHRGRQPSEPVRGRVDVNHARPGPD